MPVLEGRFVRLENLSEEHCSALVEIGLDPALWEFIPYRIATREEMLAYIRKALGDQLAGFATPFATVEKCSSSVLGSTRFLNIDHSNRRVGIGHPVRSRSAQRSGAVANSYWRFQYAANPKLE